jgi:flavin-dependent dehydrogenase
MTRGAQIGANPRSGPGSAVRLRHDVVVVGGGPAGTCAASLLAGAGCPTLLIEREPEPRHKICGEFLSIEAQAALRSLGIDVRSLGGLPIGQVRLISGRMVAEAQLPFEGVALTRKTLDETLLHRAREHGADILRGVAARAIAPDGGQLRLALGGGDEIGASALFLATGKHDLRGVKRPAATGLCDLIGFKNYFRLEGAQRRALEGSIELILFEGGYAGLQLVEGGAANLCLLARRDLFQRVGRSWSALLAHLLARCPHLAVRLAGADTLLERPLSIFQIPYGFLHRDDGLEPARLFRLGDQAGVIPSFCGDGIAIALHTGRLAAATYLARGGAAGAFHRQVRADIGGQIRVASLLYGLSELPLGRSALAMLCRAFPGVIRAMTTRTRIPDAALSRVDAIAGKPPGRRGDLLGQCPREQR